MARRMQFQHAPAPSLEEPEVAEEQGDVAVATATAVAPVRSEPKVGRNDPCPCGSGKKYKHCHGQIN
ncbi:preprotein translocase subunit SecA [compost metagenome]